MKESLMIREMKHQTSRCVLASVAWAAALCASALLGLRSVQASITWEEARRISLAKNRTDKYPIRVSGVEEWGILDRSAT